MKPVDKKSGEPRSVSGEELQDTRGGVSAAPEEAAASRSKKNGASAATRFYQKVAAKRFGDRLDEPASAEELAAAVGKSRFAAMCRTSDDPQIRSLATTTMGESKIAPARFYEVWAKHLTSEGGLSVEQVQELLDKGAADLL